MNTSEQRYQRLEPLSIEQRILIAVAAMRFFNPMQYEENLAALGKPKPTSILPFSGMDFLQFLAVPNVLPSEVLPNPTRHLQRINELLRQLSRAGLLNESGPSRDPLMGAHYYTMHQPTNLERQGIQFLARALGPQFLHWLYKRGTYQINGVTSNGDMHAGTGIAIAGRWLLTCAHVLNDMAVDTQQGVPERGFNVVRQLVHPTVDVGLLEVDRDLTVVAGLNFREPHIGERVFTFGYPRVPLSREAALVMQGGEVSVERVTGLHGDELFLFSAIARPGNSGGPILSEHGHVVGIVTQELSEQESKTHPFHAGIASSTIAQAIGELNCGAVLPVETWQ